MWNVTVNVCYTKPLQDRNLHVEVNVDPSQRNGIMRWIFERRILRKIYGPVNDKVIWRTRYSNELYTFYDELHIVKVIEIGRWRLLEHLFRIQ